MAIERTLSIIKPDAVAKNVIGQIYARFEAAGLKVVAARMAHLSRLEAEQFYAVHKERPFFKDLVDFMVSGPVMIQTLRKPTLEPFVRTLPTALMRTLCMVLTLPKLRRLKWRSFSPEWQFTRVDMACPRMRFLFRCGAICARGLRDMCAGSGGFCRA